MNAKTLLLSAALLVGGALAAAANLQEGGMPMVKPGAEHKLLASMAGSWNAETEMMGMTSHGTYERRVAMNGLWLVSDFESTMMGTPFVGLEILGWDPAKGKYVSTWVDSSSTTISILEGDWDAGTKTLTLAGGTLDPMSGEEMTMINVVKVKGDDAMTFTMHMGSADSPAVMTIEYTRKK